MVSTLNYKEDYLIIKLLWEFRQRVMRPELGEDNTNEKTREKRNFSDDLGSCHPPKQVINRTSFQ